MGCGASADSAPNVALHPGTSGTTAVLVTPTVAKTAKKHATASDVAGALLTKDNAKMAVSYVADPSDTTVTTGHTEASGALTFETADIHDVEVYGTETLANIDKLETIAGDAAQEVLMEVLEASADAVHELVEALAHLPMVGSAFKILSIIINRAKGVQVNNHNCEALMVLVGSAKMVLQALLKKGKPQSDDMKVAEMDIKNLCRLLARASALIQGYTEGNWLRSMLVAPRAHRSFVQLSELMGHSLAKINLQLQLACSMKAPPTAADFDKQMLDAAAKVCELTGQPDITVGLKMLASGDKAGREALAKLLAHGGGPSANVAILATLANAEQLLNTLCGKVDDVVRGQEVAHIDLLRVEDKLDAVLAKRAAEEATAFLALPKYMEDWWNTAIGPLKVAVTNKDMFQKILKWFTKESLEAHLASFDEELEERDLLKQIVAATGVDSHVFMQVVLIRDLLDHDQDGMVTRPELRRLELVAIEFAKAVAQTAPQNMLGVFNAIFLGYNWQTFLTSIMPTVSKPAVAIVASTLKMEEIISSYNTQDLMKEYHSGSRQWLFDAVGKWLFESAGIGSGIAPTVEQPEALETPLLEQQSSRMFLMLADAGMGKSVFSAVMDTKLVVAANIQSSLKMVRHFFKVGQLRAQGKVMVMCLAQQLAHQVACYADLLAPVVTANVDISSLTLQDTFELFLLQPLVDLDTRAKISPGNWQHPAVLLLLLDALDEADHAGQGYAPVIQLIAYQFVKLPQWVKVMLTGRPQIEAHFSSWKPHWISPDDEQNMADMLELLRWRLNKQQHVATVDVEAAAQLMLLKSKGQFVYVKYAFEELLSQAAWTVSQLQAKLPTGLSSMFTHVLSVLCGALRADGRLSLLELLQNRVLPVLVVARDLLTMKELVWASGGDAREVELLVRLLGNLFPCSYDAANSGGTLGPQHGIIRPYHKSVIDWLVSADAGDFRVDQENGHHAIAQACHLWLQAGSLQPPDQIMQLMSPDKGGQYALRHAVAHACQANDHELLVAILHSLSMWEAIYLAGFGPSVLGDLSLLAKHAPAESAVVLADMTRWLRASNAYLVKHPRAVWQLAFDSPKNSCLSKLSATLPLSTVQLLNKEDDWPSCLAALEAGSVVFSVAICPDGTTFVSGCRDGNIKVWDLASGHCKSTLEGHTDLVACVAVSSDGTTIVSGSWDKTVRVWDLASGQCTTTLEGHTWQVTSVAVSPDGTTIMSGSRDRAVRVWDRASSQCKSTLKGHTYIVTSVAVSPDGITIVSGSMDMTVRVWDLASGQCKSILEGHKEYVHCVAVSPDGTTIVSGSDDKTVRVWNLSSGLCKSILEGHGRVASVAISSDGNSIVSGSQDMTVRVTDLASGQLRKTLEGHTGAVNSVAVSPDGTTIVSGSGDATLRVWDLAADQWMSTLQEDHKAWVSSVAVNPDGTTLVSSSHDNTVRVWDLASGRCKSLLEGHTEQVNSVAVSPDGTTIVSGSYDKTVRLSRFCGTLRWGPVPQMSAPPWPIGRPFFVYPTRSLNMFSYHLQNLKYVLFKQRTILYLLQALEVILGLS